MKELEKKIDRLIEVLNEYNHKKKAIKSYDIDLYWANTCYELALAVKYLLTEGKNGE